MNHIASASLPPLYQPPDTCPSSDRQRRYLALSDLRLDVHPLAAVISGGCGPPLAEVALTRCAGAVMYGRGGNGEGGGEAAPAAGFPSEDTGEFLGLPLPTGVLFINTRLAW